MEPVSVSIGAVGLVALLTTCVECFEYIDAAKSCGRDLELLTTKFAIEKARLLIWAESVGISSTNTSGNTKVESSHVRPIVEQILNCIRMLFEDTNALTARYGLKPAEPSGTTQSIALPLRLKTSYLRFKSRIDQTQKQTSTMKKTKWAIRDKGKFTSFVTDIHQFINGLEAITNSVEMATKRAALIREELSTVEDPEDLKLIAEACEDGNQQWSDAASEALGASVCGESNYERIREWMSANSDVQMSTIVDYAESDPSCDLSETTDFPYRNHDDFGFQGNPNIGFFNSGPILSPPPVHLANQTPSRLPNLCTSPECYRTFDSFYAFESHLRKDHNIAKLLRCDVGDCLYSNDETWTDYRMHCILKHPDHDANELVDRFIRDIANWDRQPFSRLLERLGEGKVYRDVEL
ncbi:MAG: hypothetical protein LQ337_003572 [Flavoplaca oasis]|nr:MAG: hypothetical protein LQ337_003572 [Flavoplaca oasis]